MSVTLPSWIAAMRCCDLPSDPQPLGNGTTVNGCLENHLNWLSFGSSDISDWWAYPRSKSLSDRSNPGPLLRNSVSRRQSAFKPLTKVASPQTRLPPPCRIFKVAIRTEAFLGWCPQRNQYHCLGATRHHDSLTHPALICRPRLDKASRTFWDGRETLTKSQGQRCLYNGGFPFKAASPEQIRA